MLQKIIALCVVVLAAVVLAGCPGGGSTGTEGTRSESKNHQDQSPKYPIPLSERPYQQVHKSVEEAWFLVETAYFVVKDKYTQANQLISSESEADKLLGMQLKNEVTQEIHQNIFNVNEQVDQLFKDAIAAEPDNPLNYASYAYYLKARRIIDDEGKYVGEGEEEALVNIDKAIELWPDDAGFYLLKIHILSAPHQCHEWFRGAAGEDMVLAGRREELSDLFQQAERYDPDNAYINYYHAMLLTDLTPAEMFSDVYDVVLSELIAGNNKEEGHFCFPPPLPPYTEVAVPIKLHGTEKQAIYYDQWNNFGVIAESSVGKMVSLLLEKMQWPQDKENIKHLMLVLYKLGNIKPYDRSFFALQSDLISSLQTQQETGSEESFKLAQVARFLNQQYLDLAREMINRRVLEDSRQLDVVGIRHAETRVFRQEPEIRKFQQREAAYLLRAGEVLDLDFGLPDDPEEW